MFFVQLPTTKPKFAKLQTLHMYPFSVLILLFASSTFYSIDSVDELNSLLIFHYDRQMNSEHNETQKHT